MSLLLHDRAQTLLMSHPSADHRSIASEWQTTSLLVPKESRKSDGAGLRRPYGDTLRQTPSPRLPHFVPEGLTAVKKILIFFLPGWCFPHPHVTNCWIKSGKWLANSDLATTRSAPACSACWRIPTATCAPNARIDTGAPLSVARIVLITDTASSARKVKSTITSTGARAVRTYSGSAGRCVVTCVISPRCLSVV